MKEARILMLFVFLYVAVQIFYFPTFFTFSDENNYLHQTWLLANGDSQRVIDPTLAYGLNERGAYFASQYPIGVPALLLPFATFGFKWIFLSGLLLHLFGFYIFMKILNKLRYSPVYALIYLLFPGFVFFSRTVMSEMPSVVSILISVYFYLSQRNRDHIASGFFFGLACLFRYTNLVAAMPFFFVALLRDRKKFAYLCLGMLPFIVFIPAYNYGIYGAVFSTGTKPPRFNWYYSSLLFLKYCGTLLIIYPLLLLAPVLYKGKARVEFLLSLTFPLVLFSYAGIDTYHYDFLKNLVIGNRYLFPFIPILLLTYVQFIKRLRLKRFFYFGALCLLVGAVLISQKQLEFNQELKGISDVIYQNTEEGSLLISDGYVVTFLNPYLGERRVMVYNGHTRELQDNTVATGDLETPSIKRINEFYKHYTSYLVFVEPATISKFRSQTELTILRSAEQAIVNRYNHTLVYGQEGHNFIQIYRLDS